MAKRFTDTDKWKDEWYGSLSNDYRIVWQYLLDNCSIAGIFKKDYRLLNFQCNTNLTEQQLFEIFEGRIVDCGKFIFIPKFLKFQYPKGLKSNKPAIVGVRAEIEKYNLNELIKKSLPNDYLIIKDKDKVKEEVKDEEQNKDERGAGETILQEMQRMFSELKGGYKFSSDDLSHIRQLCEWLGDVKDVMQADRSNVISEWGKMLANIKQDAHYQKYGLQQLFKFRAEVYNYKPSSKPKPMAEIIDNSKFKPYVEAQKKRQANGTN